MISTSHRADSFEAFPGRSGFRKRTVRADKDPAVTEEPYMAGGRVWVDGEREHCSAGSSRHTWRLEHSFPIHSGTKGPHVQLPMYTDCSEP